MLATQEKAPMAVAAIGTIAPNTLLHINPTCPVKPLRLSNVVQSHIERILTVLSECDLATEDTLTRAHDAHAAMMHVLDSLQVEPQGA